MNQKQTLLLVLIAILITVGAGIAAIKQNEKRKAVETELASLKVLIDNVQTPSEPTPTPDTTEIDQLKSELARLQETLNNTEDKLIIYQHQTTEPTLNQNPERESYTDRMALLKEENPEEYKRVIDERRERQQNTQYSLAQRTAMFMDMDTSYMSEAELENHNAFVDALASIFESSQQFDNPEVRPNRRQMREIWEQVREAQPIVDQQRKTIFTSTFRQELNMNDTEAEDFYNNLKHIMDVTTIAPRP
ncbi:MAG TPA: hypothetical protein DD620_00125 [Verrucomicrobia bacterium]|nr:hypothetical protein [Kiritimatiellaceae bacterium]HBO87143.1 hypothetical protein [Verrucomicrobiota bacterium]|tara:strand:+ start:729 stop:1472 length:744 start_codon:yes stop_codon:yes gene_type:complete